LVAPTYLDVHDIHGDHRHIGMIYFATAASSEVTLAPAEHNRIRWFTAAELDDPQWEVPEAIRFYGGEALRRVSGPAAGPHA
jgi:hypothetical protein